MNFKQHLKDFLGFCKKKTTSNGLIFAFACGGKRYYRFASEMDLPVERALAAKDIFAELEQGVTNEYLQDLFETCEKLLDKGKLAQTAQLLGLAKSRLKHISNGLLLYKLASVFYVEEFENPYSYNVALEERKIKNWLNNKEVDSFFLQKPISDYLPSFGSLEMSLKTYFRSQGEELSRALRFHLSLLDETAENNTLKKSLERQLEQVSLLAKLAD